MKPIFIIGFPGVGKSTIGRRVADMMGLPFVDTDQFLETRYHSSVSSMIGGCGIEKFRKRETAALIELSNKSDTIISTGGGLPTFGDNMDLMLRKGIVLYLTSTEEQLAHRLYLVRATRPAVADLDMEGVLEYVRTLLPHRHTYYSRAHITVDAGTLMNEEEEVRVAASCVDAIKFFCTD